MRFIKKIFIIPFFYITIFAFNSTRWSWSLHAMKLNQTEESMWDVGSKQWRSAAVIVSVARVCRPSNTHTIIKGVSEEVWRAGLRKDQTRNACASRVGGRPLCFFLSLPTVVFSSKRLFNLAGFSRVGHAFFFFLFLDLPDLTGNFRGQKEISSFPLPICLPLFPIWQNYNKGLRFNSSLQLYLDFYHPEEPFSRIKHLTLWQQDSSEEVIVCLHQTRQYISI